MSKRLYTEEQVRTAFIAGMEFIPVDPNRYDDDANDYINSITPIELPTDEEIEEFSHTKYMEVGDSRWFEPIKVGAKWMKSKIQGGNNEQL